MKKLLIGGAAAAAMIAGAAALAQTPASPLRVVPPAAAKVHTRAEVQAKVAENFARIDANRDGFVTKAEADAVRAQRREARGERIDQRREQRFDRLDTNNDGQISRSEFDAAQAQRQQGRAERGGKAHGFGGMRMGALHGRMFDMADGNKDGRVSLQEATDAALRHFDMADVNKDGQITREERMQMRQHMRAQRRPS